MTITIVETIEVAVPPEGAWALVATYSRDPEWRTGVTMTASPDGPVTDRTTTVEHLTLAGRTYRNDGEVTALDPGRSFAWRTVAGARAHGSRTVEALGPQRCRVRLELHVTPTGVNRLLAPLLGRMLRANVAADAARLKQVLEERVAVSALG